MAEITRRTREDVQNSGGWPDTVKMARFTRPLERLSLRQFKSDLKV
jgi:hypothetical protein